jgi:hypothetical protein
LGRKKYFSHVGIALFLKIGSIIKPSENLIVSLVRLRVIADKCSA